MILIRQGRMKMNEKKDDLLTSYRKISEMWEKGLNDFLFKAVDNKELIGLTKIGVDAHSRYVERLRRNHELIASYWNLPTKKDVANVAELTIQAEEKVDMLEQQIWSMQDAFAATFKEQQTLIQNVMEFNQQMHGELIKAAKGLSADVKKLRQEIEETEDLKTNFDEMRQELAGMKEDLEEMKNLLRQAKVQPELAGSAT
jgi:predicted ribosome quality control (RQC) complex YloA/Tae2 family protein